MSNIRLHKHMNKYISNGCCLISKGFQVYMKAIMHSCHFTSKGLNACYLMLINTAIDPNTKEFWPNIIISLITL